MYQLGGGCLSVIPIFLHGSGASVVSVRKAKRIIARADWVQTYELKALHNQKGADPHVSFNVKFFIHSTFLRSKFLAGNRRLYFGQLTTEANYFYLS